MSGKVEYSTPTNSMRPIGPYSHIAKVGEFITIGATAGVDPTTGKLTGPDITSQTLQILDAFEVMLASVGSDLAHVIHINVYMKDMKDFDEMNAAYESKMGARKPARTAIAVIDVPKENALLTMNLTAIVAE
ncbi:2-iminobutanoate/2-iminopropanoate deaminase [Labrenzia sp. EL_208]|nr:2-iminobutanoate/2-iminopropanoate deaminase [Labrenzia sp. EL_142]MBG6160489.1 2-iminobutanoate/2-iminopropanoate deaminase [Labrenzia sp. EL_195]MBG6175541.1 2-iminobutanoate/2-iminopropanoate deaminase [Labrenzia sp. EL_132]MBG6230156.1 2-iminobutanoate/2-iminopropanoate deaminase [Labrenzia sp. EL_208]